MKRILLVLGVAVVVLLGVLLVRTATVSSMQLEVEPAELVPVDSAGAVARLSTAVTFETISYLDPQDWRAEPFEDMHAFLQEAFPGVHEALERETVSEHSLLYTWPGSNAEARPILLMAHLDVVPVDDEDLDDWPYEPFGGAAAEGYIWGRGAIDNKSGVMGILEAVDMLLEEGFEPARTIYLAFGHDEEIGGFNGAHEIAALLEERGVALEFVLDEGGVITDAVPVDPPVALVAVAEKGYLSLELSVRGGGGHSSSPPPQTNVGILSSAIHNLEASPLRGSLRSPTREMLEYLRTDLSFMNRMAASNLWLVRPVIERMFAATPSTSASIRTTTAATMFSAGVKDNILPTNARAVVNFRIFPGETIESVTEEVRRIIDDPRVEIQPLPGGIIANPSPISPTDSPQFELLHRTIRQVFPEVLVAPNLALGATDSRHYTGLSDNVYRFMPVRMPEEDFGRVHGIGERVGIETYLEGIRFYRQIFLNAASS